GIGFVGGPTVSSLYRVLDPDLVPAGSTLLFVLNQLGGALGIAAMTVVIGAAGDGATTWGSAAGTVPMLLPALGAAAVVSLSPHLPGRAPVPVSQPCGPSRRAGTGNMDSTRERSVR